MRGGGDGDVTTASNGIATEALTAGDYSWEAALPSGYTILTPFAIFGEFTITESQTTTKLFPLIELGAGADGTSIVISQIYGAGGEEDAVYKRDFIELFNRGDEAVDLTDWSVQYAEGESDEWEVIELSGALAPGRYLLIAGAQGSEGANLPTPNITSSVDLSADGGKVALVDYSYPLSGQGPMLEYVHDFVGYGEADWFEGSGAAPANDPEHATLRLGNGNYDLDDNAWDFTSDEPNPRNASSSVANRAPKITVPDTQLTATNTAYTFSTANDSLIEITDPDAGSSSLEITLGADNGTLTLDVTTGLTFSDGDGTGDEEMTFTGNLTNIAAALDGLTLTPETDFEGAAFVSIWADDQGNTGAGDALLDVKSAMLVVGGPVVAIEDLVETDEDTEVQINVRENDVWAGGTMPSLSILTEPTHGAIAIDDNDTPYFTDDDFFVYTPDDEYFGSDGFTYELEDGEENTSIGTVSVTIDEVNDARIATSGDIYMYADEGELVDVTFDTPDATETITWSATGLPDGFTIDDETGQISGRAQYTEAGEHEFTLTATSDSEDTETLELIWVVRDTNRLPWLDDQLGWASEMQNFNFTATDLIGNELTYSAIGMPDGLEIEDDQWSYPYIDEECEPGVYEVTFQVSGGGATDERTFLWKVVAPDATGTNVLVNGTRYHADDVAFLGKPLPVQISSTHLPIDSFPGTFTVEVMTPDGEGGYESTTRAWLTTNPSATSGDYELEFEDNPNPSFYVVAEEPSDENDDIVLVMHWQKEGGPKTKIGEGWLNGIKFTIESGSVGDGSRVGIVDANTTPTEMFDQAQYRIPPRNFNATDLWVKKDGTLGDKSVWLVAPWAPDNAPTALGQSDVNGRVALSRTGSPGTGEDKIELFEDDFLLGELTDVGICGHFDVKNVYQTEPGNAKHVWLGLFNKYDRYATYESTPVKTQKFSVAAIPVAVEMIYKGKRQGTRFALDSKRYLWGTYFEQVFVSDSGANWASDLNEVLVKEHIVQGTLPDNAMGGYLPNLIFTEEWLLVGDPKLKFDNHAVGHLASNSSQARLEIGNRIFRLGAGPATYWQLFRFRDRRTGGVSNPPTYVVDKSAFTIVTDLQLVGNDPHITVTKSGGGLWPFVSGGTVTGTQPGQFEIQ